MLYLLNKDVRTVRWNGEPLHEATSAIVKETMNGDFTLNVKYPISDSGIYQLIKEDMLIKAPTPVLGAQLFRIKKPVEHNDHLEITAYHISDDVMQRSITPMSVTSQSCGMALSRMVQNTKTALGDFSFNSDIQDRRTFNTTETETLYSVLLDGKHSIVGTWEGELVRDNFALTVKKSRGENRGVVITTHKNLKDYQRTRNSQNVVTRIHAKSTFKPEGAEKETTIRVTVDSPLINSYPYINEKEYENNNAKSVEELQKWAQAKFSNEGIDKVSDAIKIEAYELDGQVVHMGDTVNLKSWKHNVDAFKKAIAYEFDALKEEYISLTFDDKVGTGGSRASGGLSSAADAILGVTGTAQEIALEKALQNADLDFDHQAGLLRQEILDGIELARAKAEEVKRELSDTINQRFDSFDNASIQEAKRRAEEALRNAGASSLLAQEAKRISLDSIAKLEEFKSQATSAQTALSGDLDALKRTVTSEVNQASEYLRTTTEVLSRMTGQMNGFATKSEVRQDVAGLTETFAKLKTDTNNLISGAKSEITLAKTEFKKTADGLSAKMSAVESYVGQDGQRQEALRRYTREESARQATAVRELVTRDYVGKSTYQEDVRGLERRFSAISTQTNNDIVSKIAQYKQTVDGQFASITSQMAGKVNQTEFQRVRETSQLYERIIGSNENDISNKVARMALTNQLFQVEVSKYSGNSVNRALNTTSNWGTFVSRSGNSGVNLLADLHKILSSGFKAGDTVHVRMEIGIDDVQRFNDKQIVAIIQCYGNVTNWAAEGRAFAYTIGTIQPGNNWRLIEFNTVMTEEMLRNNSWMLNLRVDGAKSYKVHTKSVKVEKGNVASAWSPAPEDTEEAVRTVQSQLAGSWSVQNINSAGDIISGINLGADGRNRFIGKTFHITGETLIDKAVIKSGMVDKLKTANFEAGSVTTTILDAEAVTADKVRMDQAFANKLVASNIFTDTLAAKEAFINKLRSVVVTATFLEGFQGKIGGFRFGQYANRNGYFITGINSVSIGMGNGTNAGANRNAFWANWGESLDTPGPKAWYVNTDGKMYCRNDVDFYSKVDFASTSKVNFYSKINAPKGIWIASDDINGEGDNPDGGYNRVVWWSQIVTGKWRQHAGITTGSDRKLKENIEPTPVNALDKINALNLVSFDYIKDKTHEEIGLIAQEVLNIIPGVVEKYEGEDNHLTINYSKFVPYLIKAIQELNIKIERRAA